MINKLKVNGGGYPEVLRHIGQPPRRLFHTGAPLEDLMLRPRVALVGTRRITPYGYRITTELAEQLAIRGVVIISGLAYGVDAVAHQAALGAGGQCIAVLPSPLDNILPAGNRLLAQQILDRGGALISEYAPGTEPQRYNFVERNRLVSGLADVIVVTEAPAKSGALHTAGFGMEQGKTVFAVPGDIYKPGSAGCHNLIKNQKAAILTDVKDALLALDLKPDRQRQQIGRHNPSEQVLIDLLQTGISAGHELLEQSGLSVSEFNQALTMLEIYGLVRPLGADHWAIMYK